MNELDLVLRLATKSDIQLIRQIERYAFSPLLRRSNRYFAKKLVNQSLFVVCLQNNVVAYCSVVRHRYYLDISEIAVSIHHRNVGIGSFMMAKLLLLGQGTGYREFHLVVNEKNELAISLYRKLGFCELKIRSCYYLLDNGISMILKV